MVATMRNQAGKADVPQPEARGRLLASAIVLMRQAGLSGAGTHQVIAHSQAPKGSMDHHLPGGKLRLTTAALARYAGPMPRRQQRAQREQGER